MIQMRNIITQSASKCAVAPFCYKDRREKMEGRRRNRNMIDGGKKLNKFSVKTFCCKLESDVRQKMR